MSAGRRQEEHRPPGELARESWVVQRAAPFGGQEARWRRGRAVAERRHAAARRQLGWLPLVGRPEVKATLAAVRQVHEPAAFGWVRWGHPDRGPCPVTAAGVAPAEIGVFDPDWREGWRGLVLRAVWARPPGRYVGVPCVGGLPLSRCVLGAAVLLLGFGVLAPYLRGSVAVTVPLALAALVTVWIPAAARKVTRRHVRVVTGAGPAAVRLHRILGAHQVLAASGRRDAAAGPSLLWHGAGLTLSYRRWSTSWGELDKAVEIAQRRAAHVVLACGQSDAGEGGAGSGMGRQRAHTGPVPCRTGHEKPEKRPPLPPLSRTSG